MKKNKFWSWVRDSDTGETTLVLNGVIAEESWFGDEIMPRFFRDELNQCSGGITVWINSPGGDVFAAAQIYNMLMDFPNPVTVRIDGLAASAASVIAMAGTTVEMSPVGMFMIHNPSTIAIGDTQEMRAAIRQLDEVKESILNAYELKSNLPRAKISQMMDAESWMNAKKAKELGFVDKILFAKEDDEDEEEKEEKIDAMFFSRATVTNSFLEKIKSKSDELIKPHKELGNRVSAETLINRLNLIVH